MNLNKHEILNALGAMNVPYELRGPLLSLAVGRVIAYGLKVPSQPTENDEILTDDTRSQIERLVYDLNESIAINADAAITVASRVYLFRYRLVHSPFNPAVVEFLDALLRTGSSAMSPTNSDLMTTYAEDKALLNTLTRAIWNQAVTADAEAAAEQAPAAEPVVEEAAPVAAVESADCICPSLECHQHQGQGSA